MFRHFPLKEYIEEIPQVYSKKLYCFDFGIYQNNNLPSAKEINQRVNRRGLTVDFHERLSLIW